MLCCLPSLLFRRCSSSTTDSEQQQHQRWKRQHHNNHNNNRDKNNQAAKPTSHLLHPRNFRTDPPPHRHPHRPNPRSTRLQILARAHNHLNRPPSSPLLQTSASEPAHKTNPKPPHRNSSLATLLPQTTLTRLPTIDPDTEDAFLRPKTSWSNMLLQKPPSSWIGIIQVDGPTESSDFTEITVTVQKEVNNSYKDEYIRMKYIDSAIASGVLLPSQDA